MQGLDLVSCHTLTLPPNEKVAIFEENVDPTIAKNTQLLFEFAQKMNFDNVVYTEDDIIIENLNYYKENLNILNLGSSETKMCTAKCHVHKFLFTCSFLSNVDFFLKNFNLPKSLEELNDETIIQKVKPYQIYERSFTNSFEHQKQFIHTVPSEYFGKIVNQSLSFNRCENLAFVIKNHCILCRNLYTNKVFLLFRNLYNHDVHFKVSKNTQVMWDQKCLKNYYIKIDGINFGDLVEVEIVDNNNITHNKIIKYSSEEEINGVVYF